jgi:hypothetical protein
MADPDWKNQALLNILIHQSTHQSIKQDGLRNMNEFKCIRRSRSIFFTLLGVRGESR